MFHAAQRTLPRTLIIGDPKHVAQRLLPSALAHQSVNPKLRQFLTPISTGCFQQARSFYASKWQKRLGHLLEGRRRPAVPEIPETEIPDVVGLQPGKPVLGSKRTGLLAYKIGCMSLWDEWGERHMVTVCQADRLRVVRKKTI